MMTIFSQVRFYGVLNDFLSSERKKRSFEYFLKDHPSVKDTIESLGVPHTEVDCILVNDRPVDFSYQMKDGDRLKVYPINKKRKGRLIALRPPLPRDPHFILDSHLGKLARYLRLFGFDVLYKKNYTDSEIIDEVKKSKRVLLTRDIGLLKNKIITHGYWIRTIDPPQQIKEVIRRFDLDLKREPFRICLECNGKIVKAPKSQILRRLPPKTKEYFDRFYICLKCRKVYWEGSHYERLLEFVKKMKKVFAKSDLLKGPPRKRN